jgi:hypothetical protein
MRQTSGFDFINTATMIQLILASFLLTLFSSFNFGEPLAILKCKSASGRTSFSAELPSCDYLEKAEFIVDGVKETFDMTHDKAAIVFDPANKVFTIYLESLDFNPKTHKFLKCWAIPSSFKLISHNAGTGSEFHDVYEFTAKLYGTEPRQGKEFNTPVIELKCTLEYEL